VKAAFLHQISPPLQNSCDSLETKKRERPQKLIVSHIKSLSTKWQTNYSWDRYFSVIKLFLFLLV
jgi:hypothetical protein